MSNNNLVKIQTENGEITGYNTLTITEFKRALSPSAISFSKHLGGNARLNYGLYSTSPDRTKTTYYGALENMSAKLQKQVTQYLA